MALNMIKDPSGAPAVDLKKLPPVLQEPAELAQEALRDIGMDGVRLEVRTWNDHSGSMELDYMHGLVQGLMVKSMAATFPVDKDGKMQCYPWDSKIHWASKPKFGIGSYKPFECNEQNYSTIVEDSLYRPGDMGMTDLLGALKQIEKNGLDAPDEVVMNIIYTDGAPDRGTEDACLRQVARMAGTVPGQWLKVVALKSAAVSFVEDMDKMEERRPDIPRVRDNVACAYLLNYAAMPDKEFYAAIYGELDTWWNSL